MSTPRDLLPLLFCPLCPPASPLLAPTTLRCGHTLCAHHVRPPLCPIPACSAHRRPLTPPAPSSARVEFFPAPLPAPDDAPLALDVRVNNIIHLLRTADVPDDTTSDDDDSSSDPDPQHAPEHPPPSRHPTPVPEPDGGLEKALVSELTCEICFMLLYQPVTTPCQHTFCSKCLQRSLDHSTLCPLCRRQFPSFAYFQGHPHNKVILSLLLTAFPDIYSSRGDALESGERDARLDTPIFVCQLSFPGMPTLLHFFEPRYRLMLRRVLEKPTPTFGMIMPPRAAPIPGHGMNGSEFGTMLEIRRVQVLADGRSMVETRGTHRFRILEKGSLDGYLISRVERIDDYDDDLAEWAAQDEDSDAPSSSEGVQVDTLPHPISLTRISPCVSPFPPPLASSTPQFLSTQVLMATCHAFLEQLRVGTAPWVVQRLNSTYGQQPSDDDPSAFSFWMGMVLPIDEHEKAKLLPVKSVRLRLRMVVGWIEQLNSNWWFTSGCTVI